MLFTQIESAQNERTKSNLQIVHQRLLLAQLRESSFYTKQKTVAMDPTGLGEHASSGTSMENLNFVI